MLTIDKLETLLSHIVQSYIDRFKNTNKINFLILIGGCSRSGKTTISKIISEHLTSRNIPNLIVFLDSWLLGIESRTPDMKVFDRFQCSHIVMSVSEIMEGKKVYPPVYDPISRKRISERSSECLHIRNGVVIVDGVPALAISKLHEEASLKIFIDIDDILRLMRLRTFYLIDKKIPEKEVNDIIHDREAEEVPFIKNTRKIADIIFLNSNPIVSNA